MQNKNDTKIRHTCMYYIKHLKHLSNPCAANCSELKVLFFIVIPYEIQLLLNHQSTLQKIFNSMLQAWITEMGFPYMQVATIAWFEADSVCGSHSIAIPLVLVVPYLCRLLQCLRQYKDTKEKTTLLNGNTSVNHFFLFF